MIHPIPGGTLLVALVKWQHSFAGDKDWPDAQLMTAQLITTVSIGGGYYVRSSGALVFDLKKGNTLIPFGLGVGKVYKAGNALVNAFVNRNSRRTTKAPG